MDYRSVAFSIFETSETWTNVSAASWNAPTEIRHKFGPPARLWTSTGRITSSEFRGSRIRTGNWPMRCTRRVKWSPNLKKKSVHSYVSFFKWTLRRQAAQQTLSKVQIAWSWTTSGRPWGLSTVWKINISRRRIIFTTIKVNRMKV